jgi:tetratricopeptide (TPR) repeat protein
MNKNGRNCHFCAARRAKCGRLGFSSTRAVKSLIFLTFLIGLHALAEDPKVTALVMQGDIEERQGHPQAAMDDFLAAEKIDAKNVGVLLRISKQYSDQIDQTKSVTAAEKVAQKSIDYSQRALAVDPKNAKAHLSIAVAYGRLAGFVGDKTKLEYSRIVKDETGRSIALDPSDDFAWDVLGRWNAAVAGVGGMVKFMANIIYGGMPAASNEEAAKCLKKAVELAPQRVMHHAELARVYKAMGKTGLATKEWQAVLSAPASDKEEEKEQQDARVALGILATTSITR